MGRVFVQTIEGEPRVLWLRDMVERGRETRIWESIEKLRSISLFLWNSSKRIIYMLLVRIITLCKWL